MRHAILLAVGLCSALAAVGCIHTGVCDCEKPAPSCLHGEPPAAHGVAAPVVVAEPIK